MAYDQLASDIEARYEAITKRADKKKKDFQLNQDRAKAFWEGTVSEGLSAISLWLNNNGCEHQKLVNSSHLVILVNEARGTFRYDIIIEVTCDFASASYRAVFDLHDGTQGSYSGSLKENDAMAELEDIPAEDIVRTFFNHYEEFIAPESAFRMVFGGS